LLAFFAAAAIRAARDPVPGGNIRVMQPEDTTPDSAPTPGNTPGTYTAHTAHTEPGTHQAHANTPAAPEPDSAPGTHTAHTEPGSHAEPDSSSTPHTPRHDAPASPETEKGTDAPEASPEPAHATTDGKHATPAHNATPAYAATQPADSHAPAKRKPGRPRKHPLPPPPLPHNALDHIPPNTPAPRLDKPGLPPRVAFSPMPVPLAHDITAQALDIINAAAQDDAPADTVQQALKGVERLSKHAPARAAALIAALAGGSRHREAYFVSGLNMIDIHLFKQVDKVFSAAYVLACRLQGDCIARAVLDAATERAVEGVDEPVIGRIAKDQDGVITTKKRYSDKLAEVLLKATDARFRDAAPTTQNAATIYNIQVLHRDGPGHAPDDQAPAKVGGKTAAKQQQESQVIDAEALTID
jgi:hypothetical protein